MFPAQSDADHFLVIVYSDAQSSSCPLITKLVTTSISVSQLSVAVKTSIAGIASQLTLISSTGKDSTNVGAFVSSTVNVWLWFVILPAQSSIFQVLVIIYSEAQSSSCPVISSE